VKQAKREREKETGKEGKIGSHDEMLAVATYLRSPHVAALRARLRDE